jgi:hypothetical protein
MSNTIRQRPTELDLELYRGDDYVFQGRFTEDGAPVNLTDWEIRAQVRSRPTGPLLASFGITIVSYENGTFDAVLPGSATTGLPNTCVWDLETIDSIGRTRTRVAGQVRMEGEVTV